MKEVLFIHPFGQAFSFLFGFFNYVTGHTRRGFNRSLHLNCGLLYYFSTFMGAGIGYAVSRWAQKENYGLDMAGHAYLAMVMVLLFGVGGTTGFLLLKDRSNRSATRKYHKAVNGLSLIAFVLLALSGYFELKLL